MVFTGSFVSKLNFVLQCRQQRVHFKMNKKFANLICGLEDTDGSTNGANPLENRTLDAVADEDVIILNNDDLNNAGLSRVVAERLDNIAEQDRDSGAMEAQVDEEIKGVLSASKGYHKFTEKESEEKKLMGQEDKDEFDDYLIIVDREVDEVTVISNSESKNEEKVEVNTSENANSINNDTKTETGLTVTSDIEDLEGVVKVEINLEHDGEIYLMSDSEELDWNTSMVKDEANVADVDGNAMKMESEDSLPVDHVRGEKTENISITKGYEDILRMIANTKEEIESDTEVADAIESTNLAHKKSARKVYKCKKCKYEGTWDQYIVHVISRCAGTIFNCTVCERKFFDLTFYLDHLVRHGYSHLTCPECQAPQKYPSELYSHVTTHIRSLFLRGQPIGEESENQEGYYVFNCKTCTKRVNPEQFFEHWQLNLNVGCLVVTGQEGKPEDEDDRSLEKLSDSDNEEYSRLQPHVIKEVLDILQRRDKKKMIKRCHVCSKAFERRNECKRHLIEHLLVESMMDRPTTNNKLRCCFCPEDFSLTPDWKQHMREHSFLPAFKCELCFKSFSDSSNFSKHKKIHNLFSFICDLCGAKFNIKRTLEQHLEMHKKSSLECKYCQVSFTSKTKLRNHEMIKHYTIPPSHLCIICRKRFISHKDKWDHQWVKHKPSKVSKDCALCKTPLRSYKNVATHVKEAHQVRYSRKN